MCQLLGMNSATPTTFRFCFKGLCERSMLSNNRDGWGLALYEGRGLRTFLDDQACAKSPVARFVQAYPTKSQNVIAHIRCATHGRVGLENCHPFTREMWGIAWSFAHNGNVPSMCHQYADHHVCLGTVQSTACSSGSGSNRSLIYHVMGDTDSEALFCAILNALRAEFQQLPTLPVLFEALQRLATELVGKDESLINNFLLGIGPYTIFCYSWPGRQDGSTVWNGLYYIVRKPSSSSSLQLHDTPAASYLVDGLDYSIHFDDNVSSSSESESSGSHRMAVIATKPLTRENDWTEVKRGQLIMFDGGIPYTDASAIQVVEDQGHGLESRCIPKATTTT